MRLLTRLIVGALGVGAVVYGVKERQLAAVTKATPVRLTCRELGEKGSPDNANVILTDFVFTSDFVSQGKAGKWSSVWVPAVPIDSEYVAKVRAAGGKFAGIPPPRPVKVIVKLNDVADEKALVAMGDRETLEGLVINEIASMSGKEREILEKSYGDVGAAQVFEVGRKPTGAAVAYGAIAVGALVTLWIVSTFFRRRAPAPGAPSAPPAG